MKGVWKVVVVAKLRKMPRRLQIKLIKMLNWRLLRLLKGRGS